jgi:hypothetical protein
MHFLSECFAGFSNRIPAQQIEWNKGQTFTEASMKTKGYEETWKGITPGLHSSFVSIDKRYSKDQAPVIIKNSTISLKAGKANACLLRYYSGQQILYLILKYRFLISLLKWKNQAP